MAILYGSMPRGSYPERAYPDRYVIGVVELPNEIVLLPDLSPGGGGTYEPRRVQRLPGIDPRHAILRDDNDVFEIIMCAMEVL